MGGRIEIENSRLAHGEPVADLFARASELRGNLELSGAVVANLIDEIPILAVARAALGGSLEVSGAGELRVKESDRITALVRGLRTLGVDADERPDGFIVRGRPQPEGGVADAAADHRLVMAFAIVGLGSRMGAAITGAEAVAVSYPAFVADLERLRQ